MIFLENNFKRIVYLTLLFKLAFLACFSSQFQTDLFYPFVSHFVHHGGNPWQHFLEAGIPKAFPYPPLMLYLLVPGQFLQSMAWPSAPVWIVNLFFKLPTVVSDLTIFWLLCRMFPTKKIAAYLFYFLSPIILYAGYIHSQLDLIPTALLLASLYLTSNNKIFAASLLFGLAISAKFHVIAALPLMCIYLFRNHRAWWYFALVPPMVYLVFAAPYLMSSGYINMVIKNSEQFQIYAVFFHFGSVHLYLVPMAITILIGRFLGYRKVNFDLLLSSVGILFATFIFLVPPMPGWYVWALPFLTISLMRVDHGNFHQGIIINLALGVAYLVFFVLFHSSPLVDIIWLGHPARYQVANAHLQSLSFTILESSLLAAIYMDYRFGLHSNSVYKLKDRAFVIGIGGDSGVGKSTLLGYIRGLLTRDAVLEVEGDGDHKWERGDQNWRHFTHLNPKANHLHRQSDNIIALKRGDAVNRTDYDHDTGRMSKPRKTQSNDYILLCGLHPFYLPKMRKTIDLKIFLEADERLRRHWKINRDMTDRGYTAEQVLKQIEARGDDADRFIGPQKQYADLVINYNTDTSFEVGQADAIVPLRMRFSMDSSVALDSLLDALSENGIAATHDYAPDLKTQFIEVQSEEANADFESIAESIIVNKGEVLASGSHWERNYWGLVQLLILIMISEQLKETIESAI